MSAWLIVLVVVVVLVVLVWRVPREVRLYRRARRRGGTLMLDTPAARAALADPDDWFGEHPDAALSRLRGHPYEVAPAVGDVFRERLSSAMPPPPVRGEVSRGEIDGLFELRRCRPDRGLHYHGAGDRCQCGATSNVQAARGDDAA